MPLYKVVLRGENFLVNLTGEPELIGFDVTHYVKAADEYEARRIAIIKTRQNQHLHRALLNTPTNPTRLVCLKCTRVWWPFRRDDGRYTFRAEVARPHESIDAESSADSAQEPQ